MSAPPIPTVEPEDGAELLTTVLAFLRRFIAFPTEDAAVAVTLWAAHTHLVDRFDSTPRLTLLSPEKQCGKTRVLEVLDLLCPGSERLSDASPAYMFRRISADESVTILLDEVDAIWKRGKADESAEALRSIVNSGHRKGGFVGRVEMQGQKAALTKFPVYAPVALAGIGNCLPDTVFDRAVVIRMRRRAPGEQVDEYRERTARPAGDALRDRLAVWALSVADKVGDPWPTMPHGVTDRPADVWEPMLTVAELAGGDWPERAKAACVAFVTGIRDDSASDSVRLLHDLREVFGEQDVLWTEMILDRLHKLEEAPWADWDGKPLTDRGLATLLRDFEVRSRDIRIGEHNRKGYRSADLLDSWGRYGTGTATSATSATALIRPVADVADVADPQPELPTPAPTGNGHHPACRRCGEPNPDAPRLCDDCMADVHQRAMP